MSDLHGRPSAGELVEAVREFLERDVMAATDGRVQFHTRVAVNALRMVERELATTAAADAHRAGLAALGAASEAELAARVRGGDFDDRAGELLAFLEATVRVRLEVANPKHLDR